MTEMRTAFAETASSPLDEDPLAAVVLAEISADLFAKAATRHPDRVLNVGIRERLMVSVGGGLALAGLKPIVHTYAPFLVERAFEQVKLDLGHQGTHAVLVSIGASYDVARGGRTHQAPEDVALIDTVPGFSVLVPGHPGEVAGLLRGAVGALGTEARSGMGRRSGTGRHAGTGLARGRLICGSRRRATGRRGRCGRGCRWCGRTGCCAWARGALSCGATGRPGTTPGGTAWTRPGSGVRCASSSV